MSEMPVSLCIIVKNEEHCIADCINSVRHLVKEIIVVDTGSTDQTKTIALQNGAMVLSYDWHDDFAAARNYAIRQARNEWILVLDADEMLAPVSCRDFFQLFLAKPAEGYYVKICSYLDAGEQSAEDYVVRLFKNKPEYCFEGAIHEQVAGSIKRHNAGNGLAFTDVTIHHFGYLGREMTLKSKFQRNTTIIKKALTETPCDPFLHYCLGIEYLQQNDLKTAVSHLNETLIHLRGDEGYFSHALFWLIFGLVLDSGQSFDDVNNMLEKALYMFPNAPDLLCLQGYWLLQCAQYERAVTVLQIAAQQTPEMLPPGKIYALLGDACYLADKESDAEEAYFSACRIAPQDLYSFKQILGIKQRRKSHMSWELVSAFAPLLIKRELRDVLFIEKQYGLAMVLALLAVLDSRSINDAVQFLQVCNEYRILLERNTEGKLWGKVIELLQAGAEEMVLYTQALQNNWSGPLWQLSEGLSRVICFNLDMTVMLLCSQWSPNPEMLYKGAGKNEASVNR